MVPGVMIARECALLPACAQQLYKLQSLVKVGWTASMHPFGSTADTLWKVQQLTIRASIWC
jgi:hypothetical protein